MKQGAQEMEESIWWQKQRQLSIEQEAVEKQLRKHEQKIADFAVLEQLEQAFYEEGLTNSSPEETKQLFQEFSSESQWLARQERERLADEQELLVKEKRQLLEAEEELLYQRKQAVLTRVEGV